MHLAFADCVLNLEARQLTRAGVPVPLEPKMFTLLEVLIQRSPAVVTYDELDELLWPKVYVARTSLTRLVSELRTLLGDDPSDAKIIRTVYKTGYAFAAEAMSSKPRPAPAASLLLPNGRSLPLIEGDNVAGRDADCAVPVEATTVSRRHARFTVTAGVITVEDLGSTNGTFVNGDPISSATRLADGAKVSLGKAILILRKTAPPAPTEVMTRAVSRSTAAKPSTPADADPRAAVPVKKG
ncbi:MAG: FHA domain-containing protein [Steroidobacteraceae bacterium]